MWNEIIDLEKALYYRLLNTGAVGPDTKTSRVQDLHYIQREWRHDKTAMSTPINRTSSRSRPRSRSRGEAEDERFVKDIVERGEWYIEKQLKDAGDSILEDVMERFKALNVESPRSSSDAGSYSDSVIPSGAPYEIKYAPRN